jgi:hypothetical protein
LPSARFIVPSSDALTPGPATGFAPAETTSGGHDAAHAAAHVEVFFRSDE